MARRAKHSIDIGSLELLLDTMCNTFGGVVFIAIMLCLMSKAGGLATVPQQALDDLPADDIAAVEAAAEAATLRHRIDMLQGLLAQYPAAPDRDATPDTAEPPPADAPADLREQIRDLRDRLAAQASALQEARDRAADTDGELAMARREADLAQHEQTVASQSEQRTFRLPRLHLVKGKRTVLLGLRDHRFYAISDVSVRFPAERRYDPADVTVTSLAEGGRHDDLVDLCATGGQPLATARAPAGKLHTALARLDPKHEYLEFCVFPDSFAELNEVKRLFVERGFDYSWKPIRGPFRVVLTSEARVQ